MTNENTELITSNTITNASLYLDQEILTEIRVFIQVHSASDDTRINCVLFHNSDSSAHFKFLAPSFVQWSNTVISSLAI